MLADDRVVRGGHVALVVDHLHAYALRQTHGGWAAPSRRWLDATNPGPDLAAFLTSLKEGEEQLRLLVAHSSHNGTLQIDSVLKASGADFQKFSLPNVKSEELFAYVCALF